MLSVSRQTTSSKQLPGHTNVRRYAGLFGIIWTRTCIYDQTFYGSYKKSRVLTVICQRSWKITWIWRSQCSLRRNYLLCKISYILYINNFFNLNKCKTNYLLNEYEILRKRRYVAIIFLYYWSKRYISYYL